MLKSVDYWVVAIVLLIAITGLMRGFLREIVAVISWLLALFIAWHFSSWVAPQLGGLLAEEHVRPWAARAIFVLIVLFIGSVVGMLLGHFVRLSIFSGMDRFLGFTFGLVRAAIVLGVLVIIGQLVRVDEEGWWRQSLLIPYAEHVANGLRTLIGDERHRVTRV